ncbi:MAG TPA: Gfo/Idh/MocA family oxidoreductase [Mycobacteriales bacterium]|nr:Gfo/Idh/MocA family oxidoreductase [Mycobacteriales bacterium]
MVDVAVVGAGVMGANHVRILRQLPDVRITFVADSNGARAGALAKSVGATAATDTRDVVGRVDAAVVAVPTELHADVTCRLLEGGAHVLVEKPMASSVADAERMLDAAASARRILQVGHVERFNPAVLELDHLVRDLIHLDFARISPFSGRTSDGVIVDLMTHDLDLACALADSPVEHVHAVARRIRSLTEDHASALLEFANGITATLIASRIGQNKIRTVSLTQRDNYVHLDLLRQDVTVTRVEHAEFLSDEGMRYRQSGVVEVPFLEHRGEPLFLELQHFVECTRTMQQPRVSGEDGLRALQLAQRVLTAAAEHGPFG